MSATDTKKILFVITKGNFGGAQRYVYDLATRLQSPERSDGGQANLPKDRFESVVACGNKNGNILSQKLTEQNIRTINLENSEREINIKNDFKTFRELIRIIKEERPDILHLNSSKIGLLGSFAILYLKLTTKNYNLKSIFTAHGWAFNERNRSYMSKIIFYLAYYITVAICNATIAVSEKTKRDVGWFPFLSEKIKVIHNGIDDFEKMSEQEARHILYNGGSDKTIIFSLSELHPSKGIDVAMKAISSLPQNIQEKIIYCVAGDGEEKNKLSETIKDLGMEKCVRLLGFIENGKKLLSGADIFLFPSRNENFPYAILEAGISGLPIISTSVGGIPEIIKDMQNGILIHPNNPKEIREAILYILDHPQKRKEFGAEIKKTVSNSFSLEKMLSETLKVYELKID